MGRAQALPNEKKGSKNMKHYDIYIVWYRCELGRALWGVYPTEKEADNAVKYILNNQIGTDAWSNGETFGPSLNAM